MTMSADGGKALFYSAKAGDGGGGGGDGGGGGICDPAGGGGGGHQINIITSNTMQIDGALTAMGGTRAAITQISGKGGDAGSKGGRGGNGGSISPSGSAGGGGTILLKSTKSDVTGRGSVLALGGSVIKPAVMTSGDGGNGKEQGGGGDGGAIHNGPGGGGGGGITVMAETGIGDPTDISPPFTDISPPLTYDASGGSNSLFDFDPHSGKGGNAGDKSGPGAKAGSGGSMDNNGDAGGGGNISLSSRAGTITLGRVDATGGDVASMNAVSGDGGSQTGIDGFGGGGNGGAVGSNGAGGKGGEVKISTPGIVQSWSDAWGVSGGSVGNYGSMSGKGGLGGRSNPGGNSGKLGNNGIAGEGGMISVKGGNGAIKIGGPLHADGGSVGSYTGQTGNGGNGPQTGGDALDTGNNGRAGGNGLIAVESDAGAITTQLLSAVGGGTSAMLGQGGIGGMGTGANSKGGQGGSIGSEDERIGGTAGGAGGTITVSSASGPVEINGDVLATGSAGGNNNGNTNLNAGNGGSGKAVGLSGGSVAAAGDGGMGGNITLKASGNTLTTKGLINADGAPGGDQFGKGGNGGNGEERGGNGGSWRDRRLLGGKDVVSVCQSGNGGSGGTVTITATTFQRTNDPTAFGKLGGVQNGQIGLGGRVSGKNGVLDPAGKKGDPGTTAFPKSLAYDGDIEKGDLKRRKFRQQLASGRTKDKRNKAK
jgi:hypothetical protein